MEIERIDENTVKLYLSYVDIEKRGYTREEVWSDHTKGEELFWDMMDEIHEHVDFIVEGPLWIQVNAKSNGLEVTITKAKMDNDQLLGDGLMSDGANKAARELFEDETFESIQDLFGSNAEDEWKESIFEFRDFEDIIQMTSRMLHYPLVTSLYSYDEVYYLQITSPDEMDMSHTEILDALSVLSEFGKVSQQTIHLLKEYGTIIFEENVFQQIQDYFLAE